MSKGKWGESFLKSGLPLEHLTVVTLRSLGWVCDTHFEYQRLNREKEETWFELDISASFSERNNDTELSLLIECKYHDLGRFWFFLPHVADRWRFNDRILNCAPFQTLQDPFSKSILSLAPLSTGGIVVSEDGTKQDNAVHTAIQQLVNGFIPYSLIFLFSYNLDYRIAVEGEDSFNPTATALIPMIVTNASIFRLRPDIVDLEIIRQASSPNDIADEVEWTWCYHEPSLALFDQNSEAIEDHRERDASLIYRYPKVNEHLEKFTERPNWIAIVNIKSLSNTVTSISKHFLDIPTFTIDDLFKGQTRKRRRQQAKPK